MVLWAISPKSQGAGNYYVIQAISEQKKYVFVFYKANIADTKTW